MPTPIIDDAFREQAPRVASPVASGEIASDDRDERLRRITRTNRWLIVLVIALLVGLAGLTGWLLGRGQPASAMHGEDVHANCPFDLPSQSEALVRGIRCSHGTPIVATHCPEGHDMKRFILDLVKQGLSDQEIKAALLRRYGEKTLAGREW